jgi:hypothetical protein
MPFVPFQPLKPAPGGPATIFPPGPTTRTASSFYVWREKQLKGWLREKKLNLVGTISPEFKGLAQTWG